MNYSIEEFDNLKTKVLKYVLYKKRTEQEIKQKFINEENEILSDVIEYLKEVGYISDEEYISRAVNEFMALKNLSIKEVKYKLLSKGIDKNALDDYISNHLEELLEYEEKSLENLINKKINSLEIEELEAYLMKKGYKYDSIKVAIRKV